MKTHIEHVSENELYLLQDDELAPVRATAIRAHIESCPDCAERSAKLASFCRHIHQAMLEPTECSSDGAFWVRLAARLDEPVQQHPRSAKRPWLELIPSFILAALGGLLDTLVTAVLVGYSLINLGLLPDFGSQLVANLQSALPGSWFAAWLAQLGIADSAALQAWLDGLTTSGISGNELGLGLVLLVLSVLLALVVGLLLIWNVQRVAQEQDIRGVRAHAIR